MPPEKRISPTKLDHYDNGALEACTYCKHSRKALSHLTACDNPQAPHCNEIEGGYIPELNKLQGCECFDLKDGGNVPAIVLSFVPSDSVLLTDEIPRERIEGDKENFPRMHNMDTREQAEKGLWALYTRKEITNEIKLWPADHSGGKETINLMKKVWEEATGKTL